MTTTDDAKRERLKAALRENLKRRKVQARARDADRTRTSEDPPLRPEREDG